MQTSDLHWNQYSTDFHFFFWFRDKASLKNSRKIAIGVSKKTWEVALLYNGADNEIRISLPSYIMEAIENEKEDFKKKEINKIKSKLKLNPQTNRYDYEGDLDNEALSNFVSEDKDGFTINFGKITGYFNCSNLGLKSLKGAPTEVSKWFECTNNKFTSLEGAPQIVGRNFNCNYNLLTSLKGAPHTVNGDFKCSDNFLTSLEGAPQKVGGIFNCTYNQLTSLEGAPKVVSGDFDCYNNPNLHSLEGIGEVKGIIYKDF